MRYWRSEQRGWMLQSDVMHRKTSQSLNRISLNVIIFNLKMKPITKRFGFNKRLICWPIAFVYYPFVKTSVNDSFDMLFQIWFWINNNNNNNNEINGNFVRKIFTWFPLLSANMTRAPLEPFIHFGNENWAHLHLVECTEFLLFPVVVALLWIYIWLFKWILFKCVDQSDGMSCSILLYN